MIELNIGVDFFLIIVIVMMIELNIGANGCGFKSFRQIKFCFGDITSHQLFRSSEGERLYLDLMMKTIWGRSDKIGISSQKSLLGVICLSMTKIGF